MIGPTQATILRTAACSPAGAVSTRALAKRTALAIAVRTGAARASLRGIERAINQCMRAGLLEDDRRITLHGVVALSITPIGQDVDIVALGTIFSLRAFDAIRPALNDVMALATDGNPHARFMTTFLYWHALSRGPKATCALAEAGLGGKGGHDSRQTALPFDGIGLAGVDRANTGAPPQPPYTLEEVYLRRGKPCEHSTYCLARKDPSDAQ